MLSSLDRGLFETYMIANKVLYSREQVTKNSQFCMIFSASNFGKYKNNGQFRILHEEMYE